MGHILQCIHHFFNSHVQLDPRHVVLDEVRVYYEARRQMEFGWYEIGGMTHLRNIDGAMCSRECQDVRDFCQQTDRMYGG